jgi:hypothetical protein
MPILECSCGNKWDLPDGQAGGQARCPRCNAIPAEPGSTALAPAVAGPAPTPPAPAAPAALLPTEAAARPRGRRAAWPFLVGGVLALAVVGVVVFFVFFQGVPPDLAYVPGDAQGFASVRVADLWKSAAVKDAMSNQPDGMTQASVAALMEGFTGLKPEDVERATLVVQDAEKGVGWLVAALNRPVEPKDLLARLGKIPQIGEFKESTHQGKTYHVAGQGQRPLAVHFASDRIVIVGPEDGVKRCLEGAGGKPSGLLARGVGAASGKKDIVVAIPFTDQMKEQMRRSAPGEQAGFFDPLLEAQGVLIQGSLDSRLALEATLTFPSEEKARGGKALLDLMKAMTLADQERMKNNPKLAAVAAATAPLDAVVRDLTIEQSGSEVRVQVKVEQEALALAPRLASAVQNVRLRAAESQSKENLRQLAIVFLAYAEATQGPTMPCVKNGPFGKPLWSWRVEMLPFLGEGDRYKQLRKDEPWNGPHNAQVLAKMPRVFQMPGKPENNMTYYQVFQGKGGPFDARERWGPRLPAVITQKKGASNLILIAESATPVHWAAPGDINVSMDPLGPVFDPKALGGHFGEDINVALADGSTRTLKRSMNPRTLGWAIASFTTVPPPRDW